MPKLLHIQASPRDDSISRKIAKAFINTFKAYHHEWDVETLDLFTTDLPSFDAPYAKAKYAVMAGQHPTDQAQQAWRQVIDIVEHFKAADGYVLSVPMWNFSIPWRLKQYIDIIVQPSLTFSLGENGYEGLVCGKWAVLALARGGDYGTLKDKNPAEMQETYLRLILGFMGVHNVHAVIAQPTVAQGAEGLLKALESATTSAEEIIGELEL